MCVLTYCRDVVKGEWGDELRVLIRYSISIMATLTQRGAAKVQV